MIKHKISRASVATDKNRIESKAALEKLKGNDNSSLIKYKIGLVSLGCDKNRIDAEAMLGKLKGNYEITKDPTIADIIIVNTCGFIESSKQESIDAILEMSKYKEDHNCKVLVATGCLTQRYKGEIQQLMPEIDIIMGVNDYAKLEETIQRCLTHKEKFVLCSDGTADFYEDERVLTTGNSYAYIKIAEGCNNCCTYCIIPKIRGKYKSREMENILKEANRLAEAGVTELILVAQDTTLYGIDLYGGKKLHLLLNELSKIEGLKRLRILYCYPEDIYEELIDEIANNDKVCKYIDMPIQHISNNILRKMARRGRKEQIVSVIKTLRERVPEIALRTTAIVGFPGETEEDFNELKEFIAETKFNALGVFAYSQEEDTPAATMPDQIDENVKEKRREEIMILQQGISKSINESKVGKTYEVLVEKAKRTSFVGRSYEMAPEVDGTVIIKGSTDLKIGSYVNVEITKSKEYDLIGNVK